MWLYSHNFTLIVDLRSFVGASLEDLVTDADDKLFNLILYSKQHFLHSILPDRSDFNYHLRPRCHNLVLTAKSSSTTDRDFITRMIFKDIHWYWCWYIPSFLFHFSLCSHFSCVVILLCLFAVCQPELKSWLIDWLIAGSPPLPEGDLGRVMAKYALFHLVSLSVVMFIIWPSSEMLCTGMCSVCPSVCMSVTLQSVLYMQWWKYKFRGPGRVKMTEALVLA